MTSVCIAGYSLCNYFIRAKSALLGLEALFAGEVLVQVSEYGNKDEFCVALPGILEKVGIKSHESSPIVWIDNLSSEGEILYIGGLDATLAWSKEFAVQAFSRPPPRPVAKPDSWSSNHGYTYDLVVIGGGSGGLACSKEAALLGAKVAVLDYVKPSPKGTKWGLGGTCVNVGCIPKKLMHTAALMGEGLKDASAYGWKIDTNATHSWETMREHVQDHIKSINFGYRVQLREKKVTYINKLGSFRNSHELVLTDAKGKQEVISAARFVIAVGGRPTPLDCPGSELAISSDDLFSLQSSPGKTCVVGAGYVALECAGFLSGLRQGEVTVAIRSIPLRGFDREIVDKVMESLTHSGTKVLTGIKPVSISRQQSGYLLVQFSDGSSDEFNTVLAAVGRQADTKGLCLDNIGPENIEINQSNRKLICIDEQTSIPHIYAIGDVVDGVPELTPAAIMAGKLLAQRLFGSTKTRDLKYMDYKSIPTTVFTPLELGTVGLTEDDAKALYGAEQIDCYLSSFTPLEWAVPSQADEGEGGRGHLACFAKIVVRLPQPGSISSPRVLGIHIVSPHAGEVIQGFAVAFRKGNLTMADITSTVGIHPTVAEELTTMNITKSSGESVEKTAC